MIDGIHCALIVCEQDSPCEQVLHIADEAIRALGHQIPDNYFEEAHDLEHISEGCMELGDALVILPRCLELLDR
jgi:hypothetical protein